MQIIQKGPSKGDIHSSSLFSYSSGSPGQGHCLETLLVVTTWAGVQMLLASSKIRERPAMLLRTLPCTQQPQQILPALNVNIAEVQTLQPSAKQFLTSHYQETSLAHLFGLLWVLTLITPWNPFWVSLLSPSTLRGHEGYLLYLPRRPLFPTLSFFGQRSQTPRSQSLLLTNGILDQLTVTLCSQNRLRAG